LEPKIADLNSGPIMIPKILNSGTCMYPYNSIIKSTTVCRGCFSFVRNGRGSMDKFSVSVDTTA